MSEITMSEAIRLWRAGNDRGYGWAPYTDEASDDTIDEAVRCAVEVDGFEVVIERTNDQEIAVVRDADGGLVGIGGDAMGAGAWAVELRREVRS